MGVGFSETISHLEREGCDLKKAPDHEEVGGAYRTLGRGGPSPF
jgi:hypothetical protein